MELTCGRCWGPPPVKERRHRRLDFLVRRGGSQLRCGRRSSVTAEALWDLMVCAGSIIPYMSARPVAESILLRIKRGRNRLTRHREFGAILRPTQRKVGFSGAVIQNRNKAPHAGYFGVLSG
jgi:hypothetical protein